MLFNSLHYALFFPIVLWLYYLLPHRHRWKMLLVASCYFYMVFIPYFILILVLLIAVDYTAGRLLDDPFRRRRRLILTMSIVANLGILFTFKYYDFFSQNINAVLHLAGTPSQVPALHLILPIGLSFHTFQSLAYTIEVYRGNYRAERQLGQYALYVLFFPQMVAGPIERPGNLLPQLHALHEFSLANMRVGLHMIAIGLLKKMLLADNFATYVNEMYAHPADSSWISTIAGMVLFSFQIYFDFSGYSDIALGSAKCFGIDLMVNFRAPYLAPTISNFWRRWHISLSSWFRDYVYIPLGGNRVSPLRQNLNLVVVFFLSGLWHGANWTFAIWGLIHGFGLIVERMFRGAAGKVFRGGASTVTTLLTFTTVTVSWVFFRAQSFSDAVYILRRALTGWTLPNAFRFIRIENLSRGDLAFLGLLAVALVLAESVWPAPVLWPVLNVRWRPVRWAMYYAAAALILIFGVFEHRQFIYFQF